MLKNNTAVASAGSIRCIYYTFERGNKQSETDSQQTTAVHVRCFYV